MVRAIFFSGYFFCRGRLGQKERPFDKLRAGRLPERLIICEIFLLYGIFNVLLLMASAILIPSIAVEIIPPA